MAQVLGVVIDCRQMISNAQEIEADHIKFLCSHACKIQQPFFLSVNFQKITTEDFIVIELDRVYSFCITLSRIYSMCYCFIMIVHSLPTFSVDESDETKKETMRKKITEYLSRTEFLREQLRSNLEQSCNVKEDLLEELGNLKLPNQTS